MQRLREWLESSKTNKSTLADAVGVKPPTLHQWLDGDCLPSASSLMHLSNYTGLSVDKLLEGCEPSPTRRGIQPQKSA